MAETKNPARIVSNVEHEYGLKSGTLASRRRTSSVNEARVKAALLMRVAGLSWSEIGTMMNRDHTTMIALCKKRRAKTVDKGVDKGITTG